MKNQGHSGFSFHESAVLLYTVVGFSACSKYNGTIEKGRTMLEKKQLEHYLSECMKSEADFAEIYEELEHSEAIKALNGKTEDVNQVITAGIGIRLYKELESVYAYTNDTSEDSVISLIHDLRDALGSCDKDAAVNLQEVLYENTSQLPVMKESEKTELLKRANNAAFGTDPRIVKV